jgi:dTDP-4-amino-4,6-dideoxygalactose transaminase
MTEQTKFPLVDLAAVHRELGDELEEAVLEVTRSGRFVGGKWVAAFEETFAAYLGVREVVGLANGTDAIELAVRALEIEPGAEVLVPANTFIATAAAIVRAGCRPRFVDVHDDTGLIDLRSCEERVSGLTRAIVPVHLYGRMVEMDAVMEFAARHSLAVIEDAAQAHGARRAGRKAGAIGHVGCFSFYPGKNLGAFGDAGAAVTNDPETAERLRLLHDHGRRGQTNHQRVGFNSRLDPIHAAVLSVKLPHLDRWNEQRRAAANWYREALPPEILDSAMPEPAADVHHVFPILLDNRDALMSRLTDDGIQVGIHYPEPLPRTPAFAPCADWCPVAVSRADRQLSLPMHPHLGADDTAVISAIVRDALSD